MELVLYSYGKCSTCQQAVHFLQQHSLSFVKREINVTPPSLDELESMLAHQGGHIKKLFNTSGLQYRALKLHEKLPSLSLTEALTLLHSNGMLIKRPFLLDKVHGILGFKQNEWLSLLPN